VLGALGEIVKGTEVLLLVVVVLEKRVVVSKTPIVLFA
jgi:hypothetical protein